MIALLHGKLRKLAQCWTLDLNDDSKFIRQCIARALNGHIQVLQPRWGQRLQIKEREAQRNRRIAAVGFNISSYPEIYEKGLQARWEWLNKDCKSDLQVPMGTSRRIFREAIGEIAERMINASAALGLAEPEAEPALSPPVQPHFLTRLVKLSGELQQALDATRDACRTQGRAFYTSDLLVTLLDLPESRAAQCFDAVRFGLSGEIRDQLMQTLDSDKKHSPFVSFDWVERLDVQVAARHAMRDSQLVISEIHLLLAVLDGKAATNLWLQRHLGEEYEQVRAVAERRRRDRPDTINSPTPDGR
ncbi:hypothetical protein [Amycolatopsis sp. NPDC003731]